MLVPTMYPRAQPLPAGARKSGRSWGWGGASRQLFLAESLDTDHIDVNYEGGVLTLRIPVAERAKPRKIEISSGGAKQITS